MHPHGRRFSVLSIDDDNGDKKDVNQEFVTVDRRRRKSARQHTSPQEYTLYQSQNPHSSQTQQRLQPSTKQQNEHRTTLANKPAVVSNIKAAKEN